jgi:DNA-binding XRE family transcriptional regulator
MDKQKDAEAERAAVPPQHEDAARSTPSTLEPAKEVQAAKAEKAVEKAAASGARHATPVSKKRARNNVRKMRTERMMSKAELARRAGMSTLTIDRVERGMPCRMDTKRKILEALGLKPTDRVAVFGDEED